MYRLIERFQSTARLCVAFVAATVLLTGFATPASTYAELPNCRAALHHKDKHVIPETASGHHLASAADRQHVDWNGQTVQDDACCGVCEDCDNYFDAHFYWLTVYAAHISIPTPAAHILDRAVHAVQYIHRPDIPPPRET